PPPRPPQSTIPQLTSLLINNAGALPRPDRHGHEASRTCTQTLQKQPRPRRRVRRGESRSAWAAGRPTCRTTTH
ncbi:hypothetical protein OSI29_25095, partial [Mycobacterium ulcerans]|nr:hypothetical protein [Mycobacterium ulcerans]MEB4315801.1 hypothetical protein [Mycobacterium ulcerans]MEB4332312.1 hypothetical protein [Mycobacterium ulcerans]MEB4355440.1 hypothetical protein [Mycobacterium ulcerans]MEB4399523.1 hypothetical protein [Mycobacterium ulcerans]